MTELVLLSLGIVLLALAVYLEFATRSDGRLPGANMARQVIGSRKHNLFIYSIVAVFIMSGLGLLLLGPTSYSGSAFFILFGIIAMLVVNAVINKYRFEPVVRTEEEVIQPYIEAIEGMGAFEGIDYIVSYIQDPRWGCPPEDLRVFLIHMSRRPDDFGEAARLKMRELGLESEG